MTANIPKAPLAFIGGSGTFSLDLPATIARLGGRILEQGLVVKTPYGASPPFTLFEVEGNPFPILTCKMHGQRPGVSRAQAARQVFWVFREAGVKKIVSEGGVGSVNHLLEPRDIVIPTDYLDFSLRRDVNLGGGFLSIMRQAICPHLHRLLFEAASKRPLNRVFGRGVYVVTDGRHFESPAEINLFRHWGGDIVGQNLCPEVYLAREIGACYAMINIVVNYGEGLVEPWSYELLREIFYRDAEPLASIIFSALREADPGQDCGCPSLRKPTLLVDGTASHTASRG